MARIRQGNPGTQNVGDGSGEATLPPAAEPYRGELVSIASALSFNNPSAIQGRWKEFCTKVFTGGGSADINSIVQFVLRQSYVETNKDLQFHADKVRYFNDVKEAIRDHLNMVREQYADFTSFCRANNIDPEKDPEPGTNQEQLLTDWYAENVVSTIPGLTELLRDGAYDASVEGQVNAADAAVLDHFGEPPLPEEIKEVLLDAFTAYHNSGPPPDPSVLTAAFTELGIYIAYRGDMADCDDLHHISTPGSMTDFQYYKTCSANAMARGNLSSGDVAALEAAFQFPSHTLDGSSDQADIVALAMSTAHESWRDEIIAGYVDNQDFIIDSINSHGVDSPYLTGDPDGIFPGDRDAAQAAIAGSQLQMSLGIPTTCPPESFYSTEQWDAYIEKWEQELQTAGDDAQLANIDLQNALQKQQQTLQLMSNVSKMLHDTATAIARKIG